MVSVGSKRTLGQLMTPHLDIFMSGKSLGLNGLISHICNEQPVPKPVIKIEPSDNPDVWYLRCEYNETIIWKNSAGETLKGSTITPKGESIRVKKIGNPEIFYTCTLQNEVNSETSDPVYERDLLKVCHKSVMQDCLLAGPQVVGEELVRILLSDLYERNDRIPMDSWKGPDHPIGRLTDCQTLRSSPLFRVRVVEAEVLPKIKYWDENRNKKACWNFKDFIELYHPTQVPTAANLGDVCAKIEELDLSYSRNLVKYREHGMPWMEMSLERLPKCLPKDRLMTVLAFLGSVGMIHNGDFPFPFPSKNLESLSGSFP
ncbi:hypothetical protein PO909_014704 [Leuciscus waleckii]